ncbi:MAG TPA: DUF3696 domain-containing protein [Nitrospira sp.]|nr:DUF3696 domain-containing protein [Nitrospira sp.]
MISLLHIHNFKCFESQRFDFGALTLLAGLNGMGKSSLLQSLLLLRQSHSQGLLDTRGLALNGDLVTVGNASDALYENAKEEYIGYDLHFSDGAKARWRFDYNREADVLSVTPDSVSLQSYAQGLFSNNFHYLQAERVGPRTSFPMSDFIVRNTRQIGVKGEYCSHFLSVFGRSDIPGQARRHLRAESFKLTDQIEAWMGEFSPGLRTHFTTHPGMDLVNLEYSFVSGKQLSNRYRSTNVGFGLTYTLPVLTVLLSAGPGGLVLLENPEAHLHPRGQGKLGELIVRAALDGVQVILETHSDHVLNGIRVAIRRLQFDPEKVMMYFFSCAEVDGEFVRRISPIRVDSEGRISPWPDGFFDEWDKSLEGLLE